MGQLIRLLIIIIISSGIYVSYASATHRPKTDLGFFVFSIIGVISWLIIKNVWGKMK